MTEVTAALYGVAENWRISHQEDSSRPYTVQDVYDWLRFYAAYSEEEHRYKK